MISRNLIPLYERTFGAIDRRGRLMVFGRPTMAWDDAPSPEAFFQGFGFSEVHSLDVSSYQGCTHVHDLNQPIPPELVDQYDVVLTVGTIEHVFNPVIALQSAVRMLKVGGTLICGGPVNNWVDHGFYQFSPTLFFDYLAANRFEIGPCETLLFGDGQWHSQPLVAGQGGTLNRLPLKIVVWLLARKTEYSTFDAVPTQSRYIAPHSRSAATT
jgi:SAM-dependent methyltransferase